MQAKTLNQAMGNLNEQVSLIFNKREDIPDSASAEFYVNRPDNPLDELKTYVLNSPSEDKILFTGHLGSGKSTELNRFASEKEIKESFFVLKYSISQVLNILDIDYIDFLLSFTATLYTYSSESGIEFDSGTLELISKWINYFKSGTSGLERLEEGKTKKEKVYNFFKGITTILLRELTLRDMVRDGIRRNITQLINIVNALVTQIKIGLPHGKQLLVIIDDLEKIPEVSRADQLFVQAGTYMTTPQCKIIYTVPIALYYSLRFQQLANIFNNTYFLPNIKVKEKGGKGDIDPTGCMKVFLEKRMDPSLIDGEAMESAIENSAGVAREFVRILKLACIKSITKGHTAISKDTVLSVITDLRNEYSRGIEKRHLEVLKAISKDEPVDDQETLMELFHAKVLLEYRNGEKWTDINPVVKPLIKY